jgi:hypothetical protein
VHELDTYRVAIDGAKLFDHRAQGELPGLLEIAG